MSEIFSKMLFMIKAPIDNLSVVTVPTFIVITREETDSKLVHSAWSYAVELSMVSNIPDYSIALKLMKEEHPLWQIFGTLGKQIQTLTYSFFQANNDVSDEASE